MGTGPVADWTPRAPFEELAERPWPTTNRCLMKNTGHTVGLSCGNTWEARDGCAPRRSTRDPVMGTCCHGHQFMDRVSAKFDDVTVAIGIWERSQTSRIRDQTSLRLG